MIKKNYFTIVSFCAFTFLVIVLSMGIPYGIDSLNMIRVFNNDEARGLEILKHCLEHNNLDPNFYYYYGMVYYTTCFCICKIILLFSGQEQVSVFTMAAVLKTVSLCSFIFFAAELYRLCRMFLAREWAWMCVLTVISIPSLVSLSVMIHPDILQMGLVILSFRIAFKNLSLKNLYLAQFIGGIAFGTKYNSLFSFPFLFLPYLLNTFFIDGKISFSAKQIFPLLKIFFIGAACYLLGWIIFNPYSVVNYKYFLFTLLVHSHNVSSGWVETNDSTNPLTWFSVLGNEIPVWTLGISLLAIALCFFVPLKKTFGLSSKNFPLITIFWYSVLCFLYIFFVVRMREMRYTFHFIPLLFVFFFYVIEKFVHPLRASRQVILSHSFLIGILVTVFISASAFFHPEMKMKNPLLKSGAVIGNNFSKETKIYGDYYSYIPDSFTNVKFDWEVNTDSLSKSDAAVIVMNNKRSGKKVWKQAGTNFSDRKWIENPTSYPDAIEKQKQFYNFLLESNSGFKVFYEDSALIIFCKQ